ncbi:MAG: DUF2849 domain-containing protein [Geminicoccaceae bacterium]|nr:DUF2849 domain-containing protein [Geminicoccaceae bacterium]
MVSRVLTANHLASGDVVYLAADGWTPLLRDALIASDAAAEACLLGRAARDEEADIVVDPYLVEVEHSAGRIEAVHYRERFRARGPSVRPDLGKQALAGALA